MESLSVIVSDELAKQHTKVSLTKDNEVIQALGSDGPDESSIRRAILSLMA
ncbi:MAG TPA: hypothetical protein VIV60_18205 [Polyangiaceae bacterium]